MNILKMVSRRQEPSVEEVDGSGHANIAAKPLPSREGTGEGDPNL